MNIYFAGSMRGGRDDIDLYQEIIDVLNTHGTVLAEHASDKNIEFTDEDQEHKRIHSFITNTLAKADIMVAEVSTPSLGVGYEIAMFEGKPILCLVKDSVGPKLSALIAGNPNITTKKYHDVAEIGQIIEEFIEKLK